MAKDSAFSLLGKLAKSDSTFVPPDDFAQAVEDKKDGKNIDFHRKPDP